MLHRQTSFSGVCSSLLHLAEILFICYKLKACGNLAAGDFLGAVFPTAFAHFVYLCHVSQFSKYFKLCHYYYICHGDLKSVIFDVASTTR